MADDNGSLIGSWSAWDLEPQEQLFKFAYAYLDASITLCKEIVAASSPPTYPQAAVILFLSRHSVELFLKAALCKNNQNININTHDIEKLSSAYENIYKNTPASWKQPFRTEFLGFKTEQQIKEAKKDMEPSDQIYRYPINKGKKDWSAIIGFKAIEFLEILYTIKKDFDRIIDCLNPI